MSLSFEDRDHLTQDALPPLPRHPCSSSQERCWFIDALDPGNPALNVALRWEIKGSLSIATVEDAFTTLVERHEPLRTRIVEQDGMPLQEVMPPFRLRLNTFDLSDLSAARREEEILRLGSIEAHKPFDLRTGPLIRVTFLRLEADRSFLLLTVHQIAFDGWSIRLISREFGTIAAAIAAGRPHGLPDLAIHYGDYAAWQTAYFQSEGFDREIAYWKRHLAGAPYFELAGDHPRRPRPTFRGEILAEVLPDAVSARMLGFVQERNSTIFTVGCAIMASVLKRLSGRDDISIGTQIAGRDEPELEPIIGVFINNLVLRFDLSGADAFPQVLDHVQGTVQDALVHQRMPFHRLVELLKPPRDLSRMPLISVNFTVLQDVMDNARYGAFDIVGHPSLSAGSLYDLNFFMVHWPTGWRMALEYNTDLFERGTARSMLTAWRETLEAVLSGGDGLAVALPKLGSRPAATAELASQEQDGAEHEGAVSASRLVTLARWTNGAPEVEHPSQPALPPGTADRSGPGESVARLLAIWREVLGRESLGADDDFFDVGGHSILALRMLARVEAEFGLRIGVANLFAASTARSFAQFLTNERASTAEWSLVRIQSGHGTKTPLIVLNNTVVYHALAKHLSEDRPVIGIQLFDPDRERDLLPRDFGAIAKDYAGLIREAQPTGPYLLMGLCVAGALAYEVARQLRAAGEPVPLVVMADTWKPGFLKGLRGWRSVLFWLGYRGHVAMHHWRSLRDRETTLSEILATYPSIRRSGLLELAARFHLRGPDALNKDDWANRWFLPHLEQARDAHIVGPGTGTLLILRSAEMATLFGYPALGWNGTHADQVRTLDVPGWHTGMFQNPGAGIIAETLQPLLVALEGTERTTRS